MKLLGYLTVGFGVLLLSGCAAKNSSVSQNNKSTKEQKLAKKDLKNNKDKKDNKEAKKSDENLQAASSYSCQMADDHRKILVSKKDDGACQVNYEKSDSKQTIADARSMNFCGQVRDKVVKNLQTAGFKCENQVAEVEDHKAHK